MRFNNSYIRDHVSTTNIWSDALFGMVCSESGIRCAASERGRVWKTQSKSETYNNACQVYSMKNHENLTTAMPSVAVLSTINIKT